MTSVRIDVSSHRRLEGPHKSSQVREEQAERETLMRAKDGGGIGLHVLCLSLRAPGSRATHTQGHLPGRDTRKTAQSNKEKLVSSGSTTQTRED